MLTRPRYSFWETTIRKEFFFGTSRHFANQRPSVAKLTGSTRGFGVTVARALHIASETTEDLKIHPRLRTGFGGDRVPQRQLNLLPKWRCRTNPISDCVCLNTMSFSGHYLLNPKSK